MLKMCLLKQQRRYTRISRMESELLHMLGAHQWYLEFCVYLSELWPCGNAGISEQEG